MNPNHVTGRVEFADDMQKNAQDEADYWRAQREAAIKEREFELYAARASNLQPMDMCAGLDTFTRSADDSRIVKILEMVMSDSVCLAAFLRGTMLEIVRRECEAKARIEFAEMDRDPDRQTH